VEVLNSLIMKITAEETDINDILRTFQQLRSAIADKLMMVTGVTETSAKFLCIVLIGGDFHYTLSLISGYAVFLHKSVEKRFSMHVVLFV